MVGLIKRNFKYLLIPSFVLVYKNLGHNWIIVIVCGIHIDIETRENVQKKATKNSANN